MQAGGGTGAPDPWAPPDAAPPPPAWSGAPPAAPPYEPWGTPPPPDPRDRRRRRRRSAVALGSVAVLLLSLVGLSQLVEQRRAERVREQVAAVVPQLQEFVAQARGLPFLEDVEVEVLDDDAFLDALYAPSPGAPEPREDRDAERTLVALGLLDEDVDLDGAVTESLDEGVVGFYDPVDGRLAVRGREVDAFTRLVLVHELVHALQDQHFDTDRPELDEGDDERGLAFRSLLEGDAVRVEEAWLAAQPPSVRQELAALFSNGVPAGGEPVVEALLGFPYEAGPGLVEALLAGGGQEALDAAFREPPTSSEQILDPGAPPPVDVERPDVSGEVVDEGVLGVVGLGLLLGVELTDPGPALGWAGDHYVTTANDEGVTCTEARIAVDDPAAGAALLEALTAWADRSGTSDVQPLEDGRLRLTGCLVAS